MQEGQIKEMGLADEIYANPKTDYTKTLINAIPKGEIDDINKSLQKKLARRSSNVI